MILHCLPLIGHNLLLVYYQFEYKGNFYKYGLYYTWVQMLLQIGPLLRLGSKCYYGWDFYYAWVQMLLQMGPLLHLGPIITLVPSTHLLWSQIPEISILRASRIFQRDTIRYKEVQRLPKRSECPSSRDFLSKIRVFRESTVADPNHSREVGGRCLS